MWVKNSLENKKEIQVVTDQLRMPTYAEDLAEACWLAIEKEAKGVFNVSSNQLMSIYEIALAVADTFGLDKKLIIYSSLIVLSLKPLPIRLKPPEPIIDATPKAIRSLNLRERLSSAAILFILAVYRK
mgnify:CR=1 FL=1